MFETKGRTSSSPVTQLLDAITIPTVAGIDLQAELPIPLWAKGKSKHLTAKQILYREGSSIDRVFIIRSGMVKLLSYLPNGRARIVRLHTTGHWIGLEGLMDTDYDHTAIAADDVVVHAVPIQHLQHLERDAPRELAGVLCQWHHDLLQADTWISSFSTGGIRSRVARLIEFLAACNAYSQPAEGVELLTVCEMGEILGVTPESVSRTLASFKRSDILQRQATTPLGENYRLDRQRLAQEA